jgi:hypothetical protein
MKYLCLVYTEEQIANAMPLPERQLEVGECLACVDRLHHSGHLIAAEALQPVATATTVRLRNGKVSITDGPFAETKEQLAGFYLLEARDLDEAMQLAGKIPPARHGSVEIRPLRDLNAH